MAVCGATPDNHCCWINGKVCIYFDPEGFTAPRGGGCTLREELGSWDAVHSDPRYVRDLQPHWDTYWQPDMSCGLYPTNETCGSCGAVG